MGAYVTRDLSFKEEKRKEKKWEGESSFKKMFLGSAFKERKEEMETIETEEIFKFFLIFSNFKGSFTSLRASSDVIKEALL